MPDFLVPSSTRDHEILALANAMAKSCEYQNHGVVLAALAQLFLHVLHRHGGDWPIEVQAIETLLSDFTEQVRALPQDPTQ